MKFYLSSYKLGNEASVNELKNMLPEKSRVAFIDNALDHTTDVERREISNTRDMNDLRTIGWNPILFDLKKYFGNPESLKNDLQDYTGIWVRGGNSFVLRQAMKLSGFDNILISMSKDQNCEMLYGGYSAGCTVLSPSLHGIELVDDATVFPYPEIQDQIRDGIGIIDYAFVPHYKSDHPESDMIDDVVSYYKSTGASFKTLRDGEVMRWETAIKRQVN